MLNEVDNQMQMIINSSEIYRYWTSEMRVGLFLLLSGVVHLAAGQWLDWRTPPRLSGPPALAQAVALPQLVRVAPPAPPTEAPPEPEPEVKPQVAPPPKPTVPPVVGRPEPPPVKSEPRPPLPSKPQPVVQPVTASPVRTEVSPVPEPLPAEPVEVVSHAPRFREPPAAPVYPAQARRRNQQGQVLVEVRLDAEGRQREVKLMQSSGFASLDRAALEAVAQWKFQPEVQAGRALPSRVRIPIDFALHTRR